MVFRLDADGDFISAPLATNITNVTSVDVITVTPVGGFKVLPTVAFDGPTFSVNEAAGSATITLRRTGGLAAGATALVSTGPAAPPPRHRLHAVHEQGGDLRRRRRHGQLHRSRSSTTRWPTPTRRCGLQITGVGPGP